MNKNRLKIVKYPSSILSDGPLDDADVVPFENLQVLLLGMPSVGSRFCCLNHRKNPRFKHDSGYFSTALVLPAFRIEWN